LIQPSFRPPNWLFAPAWTVLYLMIAFSGWHLYVNAQFTGVRAVVYGIQLVFNFLWTFIFFGCHQMFIALIDIVLLWFSIIAAFMLFLQVDILAAVMLTPYFLWTSFATCLNAATWWLNRKKNEKVCVEQHA